MRASESERASESVLCVRVYIPPCVGGCYLYSLFETDHLSTSASVGLKGRETVPEQGLQQW